MAARSGKRRVLALIGFLALTAVLGGVFGSRAFLGPADEPVQAATLRVEIPAGVNAEGVADLLKRAGVIDLERTFLLRVRLRGADDELKPGTYEFLPKQSIDSVIEILRKGQVASFRMTLPEGLSVDQAAARLESTGKIAGADYARLTRQPQRFAVPQVGGRAISPRTLEGLLFPSTYVLYEGQGADELIDLQLAAFNDKTRTLPWSRARELGVTPYQVVVVASLIEKEARIPEERSLVAAVIYNRLRRGMTLGIDATVRFALKKWTGPLTTSDLDVDSPYNTRERIGLPPGPIASPGLAALKAALEPARVDFLYYVLKDEAGHHLFTASYEEFLEAKAKAPQQR